MNSECQEFVMGKTFENVVDVAAQWKGAALICEGRLNNLGASNREIVRWSKTTTKGDLDAYLMTKFNLDEVTARSVSNELTHKNILADQNVDLADFQNEPWFVKDVEEDPRMIAASEKIRKAKAAMMRKIRIYNNANTKFRMEKLQAAKRRLRVARQGIWHMEDLVVSEHKADFSKTYGVGR